MQDKKEKIIFLDVETTGVEKTDRLCQLAYRNGNECNKLFKPPLPISIEAMSITHITNEMVADEPKFDGSPEQKELQEKFDDGGVLVAHNAQFDLGFLLKEGMELPKEHICTLKVSHHFDKEGELGKNNLQYLRYFYDIKIGEETTAHDAMGDVIVLQELFEFYHKHYSIAEMVEISSKPILLKKMPFGKYRGQKFEEIAVKDLDYLLWARKAMTDIDENMRHTINYWIKNR